MARKSLANFMDKRIFGPRKERPVVTGKDRLDKRISELEDRATTLEEQAEYAEKGAELRKRIAEARKRIAATRSPSVLDGMFPSLVNKLPRGGAGVMLAVVSIVVLVLLMAKACG